MNDSFVDSVGSTANLEGLNFPALIGSCLHQIRVICGREMIRGQMYYSIITGHDGKPQKIPTFYQQDARLAYYECIKYLELLLTPYFNETQSKEREVLIAECTAEAKLVYDEYSKLSSQAQWKEQTERGLPRWLDECQDTQTQRQRLLFDKRFQQCIKVIHNLNLLPKKVATKEAYSKENQF